MSIAGRPIPERIPAERTPGVEVEESRAGVLSYTVGFGFAVVLTVMSFVVAQTDLLWAPGIAVGLVVLAFAQIGVHLVFFLHMGTGSDNTNNILALTYGMWIVFLVLAGSSWIMVNLSANMM